MQTPKESERAAMAAHLQAFMTTGGKVQKLARGASSTPSTLSARKQNARDIDKAIFNKKKGA